MHSHMHLRSSSSAESLYISLCFWMWLCQSQNHLALLIAHTLYLITFICWWSGVSHLVQALERGSSLRTSFRLLAILPEIASSHKVVAYPALPWGLPLLLSKYVRTYTHFLLLDVVVPVHDARMWCNAVIVLILDSLIHGWHLCTTLQGST